MAPDDTWADAGGRRAPAAAPSGSCLRTSVPCRQAPRLPTWEDLSRTTLDLGSCGGDRTRGVPAAAGAHGALAGVTLLPVAILRPPLQEVSGR